ncbi:unnamed protein product [Caenorhabditis auriculariae]|uniref:Uncharacterized protein n=1 Tax=Caenorhabditis auriculariae TaxID=2777116 RepID=A0A8S1GS92_9PELO|nr:unnamed protein product [Caenorhabditis auriculariae]
MFCALDTDSVHQFIVRTPSKSGYKSRKKSEEDISPLNISNMNFYALIGAVLVAAVAVSAEKARAPQFFV